MNTFRHKDNILSNKNIEKILIKYGYQSYSIINTVFELLCAKDNSLSRGYNVERYVIKKLSPFGLTDNEYVHNVINAMFDNDVLFHLYDRIYSPFVGETEVSKKKSPLDVKSVVNDFNNTCKSLPAVKLVSDNRAKKVLARYKEFGDVFHEVFEKVESSDFLSGRLSKWRASFDWIIDSSGNFCKIIEGNYDNVSQRNNGSIDGIWNR